MTNFSEELSHTCSFQDVITLVKNETKNFVQDMDTKTCADSVEFTKSIISSITDAVKNGKLGWATGENEITIDVYYQDGAKLENRNVELKMASKSALLHSTYEQYCQSYTTTRLLSEAEQKNLNNNFRNILIKIYTDANKFSPHKQLIEENYSKQLTNKFSYDTSPRMIIK